MQSSAEEQSGKGGREHMCCAKPSLNRACTRDQLSIHVKTKVTVEMHVLSDICTYMGSVCAVGVCTWVCV